MRFLSNFLLFAAYVLIYSAVAAGGKFATEPWAALFADAYATPDLSNQDWANIANNQLGGGFTPLGKFPVRPRTQTTNQKIATAAGPGYSPLRSRFP